jgi:hypothetical protein
VGCTEPAARGRISVQPARDDAMTARAAFC